MTVDLGVCVYMLLRSIAQGVLKENMAFRTVAFAVVCFVIVFLILVSQKIAFWVVVDSQMNSNIGLD